MVLLRLQNTLIYGPIASRRLGPSLGINILPLHYKLCSFNCVYCQYGWTKAHTLDGRAHMAALPRPDDVAHALRDGLSELSRRGTVPGYLTFSGNGEPTLHPDFPRIVDVVLGLREELIPGARVAILSNSSTVSDETIRRALEKLDLRIMKLDCGSPNLCALYSRPCGVVEWSKMIEGLGQLSSFTLQSLFTNLNSDGSAVAQWLKVVRRLRPERVQVYTLDRGAPLPGLLPVSKERLGEIVELVKTAEGVPAEVF